MIPAMTIHVPRHLLTLLLLFGMAASNSTAQSGFRIDQQKRTDLIQVRVSNAGLHKLEIDDAFAFRTPVVVKTFSGTSFQFHANEAGLIPGLDYHVRLDGSQLQSLRLKLSASITQPAANCEMLRTTWEEEGRLRTGVAFSGVRWELGSNRWVLIPRSYLIGNNIYSAELFLRPALHAARACGGLRGKRASSRGVRRSRTTGLPLLLLWRRDVDSAEER